MKKMYVINFVIAACIVLGGISIAQQVKDDVNVYKSCKLCGMDRGMFDFSRMLVEYDDGTIVPVCSIHCAAIDMANNIDKTPKSIKVGDFNGKQLIDAENAFWVVGGNKQGVMSKRGKWAFAKKEDADNFLKTNQGKITSFDEAIKMAYEDMYEDTKMIREKRKMKHMHIEQKSDASH